MSDSEKQNKRGAEWGLIGSKKVCKKMIGSE